MLGAIIGDIVGSAYEAGNHQTKEFEPLFHAQACFTDGSICTVAIADAVVNDRNPAEALQEWGRK